MFDYVVQAVDGEILQGQTAERVVMATKNLLNMAGLTVAAVASQMPVEQHAAITRWFG